MLAKLHGSFGAAHQRQRPFLITWRRLAVASVLSGALLICAALIYFQPGVRTFAIEDTASPVRVTETAPALPPGTDMYYYWGQYRPLDQQP